MTSASWQQHASAVRSAASPRSEKSSPRGSSGLVGAVLLALMALGSIPSWPHHFRDFRHPPNTLPKVCTSMGPMLCATLSCLCSPGTWQGAPGAGHWGCGGSGCRESLNVSSPAIQANCTGIKSLRAVNCTESPAATPLPPQNQLPCLQPGPSRPQGWSKGGLPVISWKDMGWPANSCVFSWANFTLCLLLSGLLQPRIN